MLLTSSEYTEGFSLFLEAYSRFSALHANCNHYGDSYGRSFLLEALARFLTNYSLRATVTPDSLLCTCGSSAAFDLLGSALCDPGDAVLIVAPCYFAFDRDFSLRTQARLYYVDTHPTGFVLTEALLEEAYARATEEGSVPKLVVFTNPSNPVGTVYSSEELGTLLHFAKKHDLHILSDEVYSLSVDETEEGQPPFVSFAKFVENDEEGRARVTVHWGLSKDFGLHGFRFSCLHTYNTELLALMRQLSYLYELPSPTQSLVANMLNDDEFIKKSVSSMRAVLKERRRTVEQFFDEHDIPYARTHAAFFLYVDLRRFMREPTAEEEQRLCKHLYANGGVFVSPGASYHSSEPGWFRVVFTANSMETTLLGLSRLCSALCQYESS